MNEFVSNIIDLAITEDIGDGDHSSLSCIPTDALGKVQLIVKEEGILAGVEIALTIIQRIDSELQTDVYIIDGERIKPGDVVLKITGKLLSILQAERLILNFIQRMSGISTKTFQYAEIIKDLPTKVLDTRKTTPGLRHIEKLAVLSGGGLNHRMGLYDMIMLKDNHVDFAGGIENAIQKSVDYLRDKKKKLKIEIEVRNFKELEEVLKIGQVHRIMLDNFTVEDTRKAVEMIAGRFEIESSGGITEQTVRAYAECGVDFVSVGALTHHINSLDLSLKAVLD